VSAEWNSRAELPAHVVNLIANFPTTMHPMTQLIAAVTCLQTDSKFAQAYSEKKITKVCVCLCVCARTRMRMSVATCVCLRPIFSLRFTEEHTHATLYTQRHASHPPFLSIVRFVGGTWFSRC